MPGWSLISECELPGSTTFSATTEKTFKVEGIEIKEVTYTDRYFQVQVNGHDVIIPAASADEVMRQVKIAMLAQR